MCSLTYEIITAKTKGNKEYDKIKKLNCWASNLKDVSILNNLPKLEVLTLSVNEISTLKSVQKCVHLTELYIRNNKIVDLDEIYYLKNLNKLKILWLADNPAAQNEPDKYRLTVICTLKNLLKLDNIIITNEEREQAEKFGKEINEPPSFQQQESLLDIIESQEFSQIIKPLTDLNIDKKDRDEDVIVTDLIADNQTIELTTLNYTNESNYSTDFKRLDSDEYKSNDKTKSEESIHSRKLEIMSAKSSNVLPAVLLLLNELNSDDLEIVVDMCLKRQSNLNQL